MGSRAKCISNFTRCIGVAVGWVQRGSKCSTNAVFVFTMLSGSSYIYTATRSAMFKNRECKQIENLRLCNRIVQPNMASPKRTAPYLTLFTSPPKLITSSERRNSSTEPPAPSPAPQTEHCSPSSAPLAVSILHSSSLSGYSVPRANYPPDRRRLHPPGVQ